ncbi:MAG: sugar kinase [Myxococcales bacterium]|nr:sugar kinase [Myxococcales bacterium]
MNGRAGGTVVAVGHVTWDVLDGGPVTLGGSVSYAAHAWAALGRPARVFTAAREATVDLPAPVHVCPSAHTTAFRNDYTPAGDRAQVLTAQAAPLDPAEWPAAWDPPVGLFLCPVLGEVAAAPWLRRPAGLVVLGLQGWLKQARVGGPVRHGPAGVDPRQFAGAHVACLSTEDLAGDRAWLDALQAVVPRVVLTDGARGSVLFERGRTTAVGVAPVPRAVDPTGAGDSFAAGLVAGLLEGRGFVEAARLGAALASVVVEHPALAPASALRGAWARAPQVPVSQPRPAPAPAGHASSPCADPAP